MFAFVLFDRRTKILFAARDRFGVKPLYIYNTPTGGTAFASEIKQFTVLPGWKARLNGQRAYDFLNWGLTDHTRETLYSGVRQLRGGEMLMAELSAISSAQPVRWYELRPSPVDHDFTAASERFRELFDDSIRLRLRADVPVGSCLSGGLDSSSIVCTMRQQLGDRATALQKTFSAYSDVARFDERNFIEAVVKSVGAEAHTVVPDPNEMVAELDRVTWHQDEPFGSTSIWAQWCVFRMARTAKVLVMLDGQGADEALGGYHGYFAPHLAGLASRGSLVDFFRESSAARQLHGQTASAQLRLLANELCPPGVANFMRGLIGRTVNAPAHLNLQLLGAEPLSPHRLRQRDHRYPIRALSYAQLTALNLPMLLHWEDRDSMAHGVEARIPFLDYRLVEFCLGLPEAFKLSAGWTKRVLRQAMRDRLPEMVRSRRDKLGFATAEEVWMRHQHKGTFSQLAYEAIEESRGLLTPAAKIKVESILSGAEPFNFWVWRIISFGRWMRRFDVQTP
jgi:asparagine synthase (glutamine-hydrolysing)